MQNGIVNMGINIDQFITAFTQITNEINVFGNVFNQTTVNINHDADQINAGLNNIRNGLDEVTNTARQSNNHLEAIFNRQEASAQRVTEVLESQSSTINQLVNGALLRIGEVAINTFGNIVHTGIEATKVYEDMSSKLSALTGSMDSAKDKFWELNTLEDETCIATDKLSQAFITLGNNALGNSSAQLKAYAAIATGTGKDINELASAVVRFSQGRMNALSQFGITAKENADSIVMTYKGVDTAIEKNSQALEKYLSGIASNNFDGVLTQKYNTVEASMNRLDNAWGTFCTKIMQSDGGFGELIIMGNDFLASTLNDISEWFNQPDVVEWFHEVGDIGRSCLESLGKAWNILSDTFTTVTGYFHTRWTEVTTFFESLGLGSIQDLKFGFTDLFKLIAHGLNTVMTSIQTAMTMMGNLGSSIAKSLAPDQKKALINAQWKERVRLGLEDPNNAERYAQFTKEQNERLHFPKTEDLATKNAKVLEGALKDLDKAAKDLFSGSNDRVLAKLLETSKLSDAPVGKPIGKTDDEGSGTGKGGKGGGGRAARQTDTWSRYYERLLEMDNKSKTQLEQLEFQHAQKLAEYQKMITENAHVSAEERANALLLIETDYQEKRKQLEQDAQNFLASLNPVDAELIRLQDGYSKKLELLEQYHADQLISEEMFLLARSSLYDQYTADLTKAGDKAKKGKGKKGESTVFGISEDELKQVTSGLEAVSNGFASMTQNMDESSGTYRTLFAVQKSFSVASATLSCIDAWANALKTEPFWPAGLAAYAQALAMTGQIMSQITSVSMHDKGGTIAPGQYGIVGEIGPELVRGPATVTSRKDTADLLSRSGDITVNLIEDAGRAGQVNQSRSDEQTIIEVCVANIRRGGDIADAISNTYGVARQGV